MEELERVERASGLRNDSEAPVSHRVQRGRELVTIVPRERGRDWLERKGIARELL